MSCKCDDEVGVEIMHQKLQDLLPEFVVEPVTMDNLSTYEPIFYSNEEYYYITDGQPATRELSELKGSFYTFTWIHNISKPTELYIKHTKTK